jgi:hypothetical protein
VRRASAAAALIEEDDAVDGRIPEPSVHRACTAARPSMHEQRRLSLGIAALLEVHRVQLIDAKVARFVWLDFWK